mgnify:CR=1 FL=1
MGLFFKPRKYLTQQYEHIMQPILGDAGFREFGEFRMARVTGNEVFQSVALNLEGSEQQLTANMLLQVMPLYIPPIQAKGRRGPMLVEKSGTQDELSRFSIDSKKRINEGFAFYQAELPNFIRTLNQLGRSEALLEAAEGRRRILWMGTNEAALFYVAHLHLRLGHLDRGLELLRKALPLVRHMGEIEMMRKIDRLVHTKRPSEAQINEYLKEFDIENRRRLRIHRW